MKIKPVYIFCTLCILFLTLSIHLYLKPFYITKDLPKKSKSAVANGRLVWQKYNCQSCHQMYGLGGYLGPDLTNVYSRLSGNTTALDGFLKQGIKQMPKYNLSERELKLLMGFLKETDASGSADPRDFKIFKDGMIEKNENK